MVVQTLDIDHYLIFTAFMSHITQLSNEPNHENKFWSQDENTDYTIKRT